MGRRQCQLGYLAISCGLCREAKSKPMTTLGNLLDGIVDDHLCSAQRNRSISGVFDDSRRVLPDGIFVALRGTALDGRRFVNDAISRGAAVVISEDDRLESCPPNDRLETGPAMVRVGDARVALARLAMRWYGLELQDGTSTGKPAMRLLGVTGTNGKTTTAHMTREVLKHAGMRCGLLGTVQNDLCGRSVTAEMTTPGPLQLAAMLRECADAGASAAVMEVSSHALDQKRTAGLRFAAAAFTNLTQDHLDYHRSMDLYAGAKARLFEGLDRDAVAIVNADDPATPRMVRDCKARILTYGLSHDADLCATITRDSVGGTLYRLRIEGRDVALENAIVGRHNVYNALAAAGLARATGASIDAIIAGLGAVRNVAGRLQRVPCVNGVDVFVDYAHTDDALRNVASVLQPLAKRRLIVVFGCGGDRDRSKRPKMARAAAEFADAIIVTSDNPRTEEPTAIISEILSGFDDSARRKVAVQPDRRKAIFAALSCAEEGDVVLIAGKGHEDYQIVGTTKHHFDDVEVAIEAAAARDRALVGAGRS